LLSKKQENAALGKKIKLVNGTCIEWATETGTRMKNCTAMDFYGNLHRETRTHVQL